MTCNACKFSYSRGEPHDLYVCRRYPPPAQLVEIRHNDYYGYANSGRFRTDLPSVTPDWWCGEYQQRDEEKDQ